jgi:hypothetical protein
MEKKHPSDLERLFGKGLISGRRDEMTLSAISPDPLPPDDPAFDQLESAAEVFGFVHKMAGEAGLRDLLARGDGTTSKEWLLDAAAELSQAGLGRVSGIVLEVAAQTPSMVDVEAFCSYPDVPGQEANRRAWQRAEERRKSEWELKRQPAK